MRELVWGNGIGVGGYGGDLVAIAVEAVVNVGGVGRVAGAGAVAVIAPCIVLDIEGGSARIVHELAVVIGAEVAGLA